MFIHSQESKFGNVTFPCLVRSLKNTFPSKLHSRKWKMFKFYFHPPPWKSNVSECKKIKLSLDPKPRKTITTIRPPPATARPPLVAFYHGYFWIKIYHIPKSAFAYQTSLKCIPKKAIPRNSFLESSILRNKKSFSERHPLYESYR